MLSSVFAEDLFLKFYDLVLTQDLPVQGPDYSPILNLGQKIIVGEKITQNQANYILKLLEKYKNISARAGYEYQHLLPDIVWKHPFRILDLTKKIYVEQDIEKKYWVCLKFPYQLKKQFEDEIIVDTTLSNASHWDSEARIRKLSLYDFNLINLYEFAVKHNFDIDESFMSVLAEIEEIWQNHEKLTPRAIVTQMGVLLENCSEETDDYFTKKCTGNFFQDAFLAKTMGYPVDVPGIRPFQKMISSSNNSFWVKDNATFFDLYHKIDGKICVILDRTGNTLQWLQNFIADSDKAGIHRDFIKVCFRENKENSTGINDWVKLAGVGGKVEEGKILIFEYKPAKWLFKNFNDVKMIVTNNLYPSTSQISRDLLDSHPCVIYLGDIKPSEQKGQTIVEL